MVVAASKSFFLCNSLAYSAYSRCHILAVYFERRIKIFLFSRLGHFDHPRFDSNAGVLRAHEGTGAAARHVATQIPILIDSPRGGEVQAWGLDLTLRMTIQTRNTSERGRR